MKVFLLCSAHLDPVWQWDWDEGAAEALSTFRCAADFCEEYDGFVFNHNEALLYQYVEKYDPELFCRIGALIKAGKWFVMGGWYLQPDCNLPSGESIIAQIEIGLKYFKEKFNVSPKIALNIDSFGHSKGLVQILKKCGYEGYLFMRPMDGQIELPENEFVWQGYDQSEIVAMRYPTWYNTSLGESVGRINDLITGSSANKENLLILWGMGNHGGGPSKQDIEAIDEYAKSMQEKGIHIVHSNVQSYFETINKSGLPVYDLPLYHSMPGCYSSMARVKREHRELENDLFLVKSICSYASITSGFKYPKDKISEAILDLCFSEFHDLLPGTSIKDVENTGLQVISHGKKILSELKASAFFCLCKNQRIAGEQEIPIFVYNPFPFVVETEINCEFMLQNQNHNDKEVWVISVYDKGGNTMPSQQEKERSNINLDWRKMVVFSARLQPLGISRFDCKLSTLPIVYRNYDWRGIPSQISFDGLSEEIVFVNNGRSVSVSKDGLVCSWIIDGNEIISQPLGKCVLFKDTCDPWGMEEFDFTGKIKGEFSLVSPVEAAEICGFDHPIPPVRIVENGEVRTIIESIWSYGKSYFVLKSIVPKHLEYVDLEYDIFMAEKDTMLKAKFTPKLNDDKVFTVDDIFGSRVVTEIGKEQPIHNWSALSDKEYYFAVINKGQYSADYFDDAIRLTFLRTPAYAAHPTDGGVPTIPQTRYSSRMDLGEHSISIRLFADKRDNYGRLTNNATVFNIQPYVMSFFPDGSGIITEGSINVDDDTIQLTNFELKDNGYLIRLFNPNDESRHITVSCFGAKKQIDIKAFSIESFIYSNGSIELTNLFGTA